MQTIFRAALFFLLLIDVQLGAAAAGRPRGGLRRSTDSAAPRAERSVRFDSAALETADRQEAAQAARAAAEPPVLAQNRALQAAEALARRSSAGVVDGQARRTVLGAATSAEPGSDGEEERSAGSPRASMVSDGGRWSPPAGDVPLQQVRQPLLTQGSPTGLDPLATSFRGSLSPTAAGEFDALAASGRFGPPAATLRPPAFHAPFSRGTLRGSLAPAAGGLGASTPASARVGFGAADDEVARDPFGAGDLLGQTMGRGRRAPEPVGAAVEDPFDAGDFLGQTIGRDRRAPEPVDDAAAGGVPVAEVPRSDAASLATSQAQLTAIQEALSGLR